MKIQAQVKAKKLKRKFDTQTKTSYFDVLKDVNLAIATAEKCLDRKEIVKLPFKNVKKL